MSSVDITNALNVMGWMKPVELRWLAWRAKKCNRILEIGSYHGRSTIAMLDNSDACMWCVDSWDTEVIKEKDYQTFIRNVRPYRDKITVLRGDGKEMLMQLQLSGKLFDMAFIDDGHGYQFVHADISNSVPLIRPGGLICGHDYNAAWPGVMKAVEELVPGFMHVKGTSLWWKVL